MCLATIPANEYQEADDVLCEAARCSLLHFMPYVHPGYRMGSYHRELAEKLESVWRGEIRRLMVSMPPRHGKSRMVSQGFPCWCFGQKESEDWSIVQAGYGQEIALEHSEHARNIISGDAYQGLFPGVVNSGGVLGDRLADWRTQRGGRYMAVGVGGALTGKGCHLAIIDDPVKNREDANSPAMRRKVLSWYKSTLFTRQTHDGRIILVMTRWHPQDLAGTLLREMRDGGQQWEVIEFPALDAEGRALWPEGGFDAAKLASIRQEIGSLEWASLYQQKPIAVEDMTFPPFEKWAHYDALEGIPGLAEAPVVGFFDPSKGTGKGDYAAIATVVVGGDGRYYLVNMTMDRSLRPTAGMARVFDEHAWLAGLPGRGGRGYRQFGVESNFFQELLLEVARQEAERRRRAGLRGDVPLKGVEVKAKKELRIAGLLPEIENGWLVVPRDADIRWPELFEQFASFGPESTPEHDDGPDALASAMVLARQSRGEGRVLTGRQRGAANAAHHY